MARGVGATLIVAGCALWAFVAGLGPGVEAAAVRIDRGSGEVQLMVIEHRQAPLLVVLIGVAVLFASSSLSVSRSYVAFGLASLVLVVADGVLGRTVTDALAAAVAGALLLALTVGLYLASRWFVGRAAAGDVTGHAGHDVSRRFLLGVGAITIASLPAAEFLIVDDWDQSALPGGYEPAVGAAQVLLAVTALAVIAVALRSADHAISPVARWVVAAAVAVIVGCTAWMLATSVDMTGMAVVIVWGVLMTTMAAVAAATDRQTSVKRVLIRAGFVAVTFPIVLIPAIYLGFTMGTFAYAFTGGEIGADGLPLYPVGVALALVPCIVCSGVTPLLPRASEHEVPAAA